MTRYETLQIILTAFILAAAIIAACIYGCQLSEMQKSTKAATTAAEAATKSADATEESVKVARENAQFDQRAWVTIRAIHLAQPLAPNQQLSIQIILANSGRTPAIRAAVPSITTIVPSTSTLTEDDLATVQVVPASGETSRIVMGPNTDFVGAAAHTPFIGDQQIDALRAATTTI
jgi:hypothetical protein